MPYCTWMLAELGADVVKIERPGRGDVVRGWDGVVSGLSTGFVWVNSGKRDIAVDVASAEGAEIVRRLVAGADVFVENFAPGVAARLGLAYADLAEVNAQLVYCSLSGYGQEGPAHDIKAYDLLIQGETGVLLSNGTPEEPAKVGLPIADLVGGTVAAVGILAALRERDAQGVGRYVDVAMFDSMLTWLGYFPQYHWHAGIEPPRSGMRHQYLCPYGPYLAADGRYVNLVVASDAHWKLFCEKVVRRPEWVGCERFGTIESRKAHRAELEAAVEELIATEPSPAWRERLAAVGLPYGDVRGVGEVLEHPNVEAHGLIVEAASAVGPLPLVRFPLSQTGPQAGARRIPELGEDTDTVLSEIGYSSEEIAALRDGGVLA